MFKKKLICLMLCVAFCLLLHSNPGDVFAEDGFYKGSTEGIAYAIVTNDDLVFFRSNDSYTSGADQTITDIKGNTYTGYLYSNIENKTRQFLIYEHTSQIKKVYVASGQTIQPVSMYRWFYDCSSLTSFDGSGFDTSSVTNMNEMFHNCTNLTSLDVSMFDTRNVTEMDYMFCGCCNLSILDLSSFDTGNVYMTEFLNDCSSLRQLILGPGMTSSGDYGLGDALWSNDALGINLLGSELGQKYPSHALEWAGKWDNKGYAYAVLAENGDLVFFRSWDSYMAGNNRTVTDIMGNTYSGKLYVDYEDSTMSFLSDDDRTAVKTVYVAQGQTIKPYSMGYWLSGCSSLYDLDLKGIDTSNVTSMASMLADCSSLTSLDLSNFDTSNVEDMSGMFSGCSSLESLDLSSFETNNAIWMYSMFNNCNSLRRLILGPRMIQMDERCGLQNALWSNDALGIKLLGSELCSEYPSHASEWAGKWENKGFGYAVLTSDGDLVFFRSYSEYTGGKQTVKDVEQNEYTGIVISDVEHDEGFAYRTWDNYSNEIRRIYVANGQMVRLSGWAKFERLERLISFDGSGFDTSCVRSMSWMFNGCGNLKNLDLSSFDTSNVTSMYYMFSGCSGLTSLNLGSFNTSNVENMAGMFGGCSSLPNLDLSNFDTSSVIYMNEMFVGCSSLPSLDLSNFDTSNVTSMSYMFSGCSGLTSLDLSNFDTSNVEDMSGMFSGCCNLTSLNPNNFDTSNVTNMSYMFAGCSSLTSLDLSSFDTSIVHYMAGVFSGCSGLNRLDLSSFDTRRCWNMNYMFSGCERLKTLDISSFDTNNLDNMSDMFNEMLGLETIVLGKSFTKWTDNNYLPEGVWINSALSIGRTEVGLYNEYPSNASNWAGFWTRKINLTAIYNSSNGADIRFKGIDNATAYVIERKENGVWSDVITVNASDLEKAGNDLKYIDQSIKGKEYYGKGYIYSVAAIVDGVKSGFDTTGLALYRLEQPEITSVSIDKNGKCTATWKSTNAHGYELQYSSDNGKTWTKAPETDKLTVTVSGLDPKASYVFRLRSFKDNADRGRTYSQYSAWVKPDEVVTPVMETIYNSANGADIRWKIDSSKSYVIMRKENGVWKEIRTVEASTLEKEGSNYKYIDTEVKSNYGKGYIYSVAVKDSKGTLHYDTAGLALYRLAVPKITKAEKKIESNGTMSVTLTWNKVDAHGYEVQYSSDGGKTWTKATQVTGTTQTIKGLDKSKDYVFRMRCQKTNASRGTTWSQYSEWTKE